MTHDNAELDALLDVSAAARYLNVSVTSLRRWTNDGRLHCFRVGGKRERRFRRADLDAFLAGARAAPGNGMHLLGLYDGAAGRSRGAARAVADGLGEGGTTFLCAHPAARRDMLRLAAKSRDVTEALRAGRLIVSSYATTLERQIDYWRRAFTAALSRGARSLHVVGDVSAGPLVRGKPVGVALEYERAYEHEFGSLPLVTLCQYDTRTLTGSDVLALLNCHLGHASATAAPRRA